MLSALLFLLMIRLTLVQNFNVYYIYNDRLLSNGRQLMFDCLPYYVNDRMGPYGSDPMIPVIVTYEIILYCFRPLAEPHYNLLNFSKTRDPSFTFNQLRMRNVTSDQLYLWSAPIDLIEEYEIYLNTNVSSSTVVYYNCTDRYWFGPLCQYSFGWDKDSVSFANIVEIMFREDSRQRYSELGPSIILTNLSCYMHLQCNRGGPFPACLDWREICDGKVDCIDGGFDERNCDQLEINECKDNEYRCHNGQCIPQDFFRDNILNPDCLDGTDEFVHNKYPALCAFDPTFRCENIKCRPSTYFNMECGDGQCTSTKCVNKRDIILKKTMILSTLSIPEECRDAMICLTGFHNCITELKISQHCPEHFQFPEVPVLYGHIKFFYSNNESYSRPNKIIFPMYICYDPGVCPFPSAGETSDKSSHCQIFSKMSLEFNSIESWNDLLLAMKNIFHMCSVVPDGHCQHKTILYNCKSTKKCISKYRLMDGIRDCLLNDDEQYSESCSLRDRKYRFSCENRCLSPIIERNGRSDCSHVDDEDVLDMDDLNKKIFFQTICDGFTEINPPLNIDGQNYTDETECEFWPCNNTYTRCNGIWNCIKGEDEVNCSPSPCPPLEHMCVSPVNNSLFCLPIERAGNGIVDCLGASDERQLCRTWEPDFLFPRFWCRNDTRCIFNSFLCNGVPNCRHEDDEQFCPEVRHSCTAHTFSYIEQEFLCSLSDISKQIFIPFSLKHSRIYPRESKILNLIVEDEVIEDNRVVRRKRASVSDHLLALVWWCHRGLHTFVRLEDDTFEQMCLCPPGYYGDHCQYQNQRVSVTLQVRAAFNWRLVFVLVFTLIDDDQYSINSHDVIEYLPFRDCGTKFNVYLLYSTKPKNISKTYSVRIDIFIKHSLEYHASLLFPIQFSFLPVNRMALQIIIPIRSNKFCSLDCGINGQCSIYVNSGTYFCRCNHGWSGSRCDRQHVCECSPSSLCTGPSICLCPLHQFGPRCYLKRNLCSPNPCKNNGICIPPDVRSLKNDVTCICSEEYSGGKCQYRNTRIDVTFRGVTIPPSILIHYIEVFNKRKDQSHLRTSTFKKIGIYEDSFTIYRNDPFHIMFTELFTNHYLTILQERFIPSVNISTDVISSHRCLSVNEIFNESFVKLHLIRRIKSYHTPCQQRFDLTCFYDDTQICLCNLYQHANCFDFEHNMTYNCRDVNYCENGGRCFQDDSHCPKTTACLCLECYYGSRCQFSTKGVKLALDIIIGYHIYQNNSFTHQPLVIKISAVIAMTIVLVGILNGILSIIIFKRKHLLDIGCTVYLLASSILSILTMVILALKFWLLVISQMGLITNRHFLQFNCIFVDYFLQVFVTIIDWLHVCIAIERIVTVIKETSFDKSKSKRAAKWVTMFIVLFATSTLIQDPIHRRLIDDEEEQRTLCVTKYSSSIQIFDSVIIFLHFIVPFTINMISALLIIIAAARRRSKFQNHLSHIDHLHQQFQQHKHLLISSCILAVLALPRLIISFLSNCMKSIRNPWLFLIGYFISFIPSALNFIVFVLPSNMYMREFKKTIKHIRRIIR